MQGRPLKPTSGRSNRPSAGFSKPWIRLSSRKILLIKGRSRLAPPSRSGMGTGKRGHTISWALKKRNLNAGRLVGFHRWRGRFSRGERVTKCGFDRQQVMRN